MGLKAEPLRPEDARELEPSLSPELEAAALRPEEASIDNRAFTRALLIAAKKSGVEIFAGNGVTGIVKEGGSLHGLETRKRNGQREVDCNCRRDVFPPRSKA